MSFTYLLGWLTSTGAISELQSIFQLGVGMNLVALGYAERRLSLEEKIEEEINDNIESLNLLHQNCDRIIDETDPILRRQRRAEIDSTIQKKWDVIQIGVISTKINNNYYRLRYHFHRSDAFYRALMFSMALFCCTGLFVSSLAFAWELPNWLRVVLGLVSVGPAIIRFYHASRQASAYRPFVMADTPMPSSEKLEVRHARISRTIEEEKIIFATRLNRSPNGFTPDKRFVSVAQEHNPTALYFISGQVRSRIKTLASSIHADSRAG